MKTPQSRLTYLENLELKLKISKDYIEKRKMDVFIKEVKNRYGVLLREAKEEKVSFELDTILDALILLSMVILK